MNTPEHCNCRAGIFPAQMEKQLQDELRLVCSTAIYAGDFRWGSGAVLSCFLSPGFSNGSGVKTELEVCKFLVVVLLRSCFLDGLGAGRERWSRSFEN